MALEGLIGSEEEEQVFQKGQKRERFMAGLGDVSPIANMKVVVSGNPIFNYLKDSKGTKYVMMALKASPTPVAVTQQGITQVPVFAKSETEATTQLARIINGQQKATRESLMQQYGSVPAVLYLTHEAASAETLNFAQKLVKAEAERGPPPTVGKVGTPSKSGCFIATASYGTPLAPEIESLRNFRDERLMPSLFGRAFIKFYYTVSPPIAAVVARVELFRKAVRAVITPLVRRG